MSTLRRGMPEEIATGIRNMGKQFSRELIMETRALYAGIPRLTDPDDIVVTRDIAYGDHERQRLDVHVRKQEPRSEKAPVIMFVHGGGFVLGDRDNWRHIPEFFAGSGYIGVNMTYRLAPEYKWPAGGRDVGAAVAWVYNNIATYGGDPDRIFLIGESAGAFHTATYVFRPDVLEQEFPEVTGVVMVSGPFMVATETANESEASYYGDDPTRWGRVAFPGNLTRTHIPALFTVAEFDPLHIDQGLAMMLYELIMKHEQLPGHNHLSGTLSVGTEDGLLTEELFDFISTVCDRASAARG